MRACRKLSEVAYVATLAYACLNGWDRRSVSAASGCYVVTSGSKRASCSEDTHMHDPHSTLVDSPIRQIYYLHLPTLWVCHRLHGHGQTPPELISLF